MQPTAGRSVFVLKREGQSRGDIGVVLWPRKDYPERTSFLGSICFIGKAEAELNGQVLKEVRKARGGLSWKRSYPSSEKVVLSLGLILPMK